MCHGRHRVENRVGMRHVAYFTDRPGIAVQMLLLSLGKRDLRDLSWVTKSRAHHFAAVLSELHNAHIAPALDGIPALQVRSAHGTR